MKALEYAKTRTLPSDLLAGVFSYALGRGLSQFRADDNDLQEVFAGIDTPLVRRFFVFSTDGPVPFSPALDDAMSKLQLAGLIGRINPAYDEVVIKPSTSEYFQQVLMKRLNADEVAEIERIAAVFVERFRPQTAPQPN